MNRFAMWVSGVLCGVIAMQAGHWLYLRNSDYGAAMFATSILGFVLLGAAQWIGDDWE